MRKVVRRRCLLPEEQGRGQEKREGEADDHELCPEGGYLRQKRF